MVLRNNCTGSVSRPGGNVKAITIVFDRLEGRVGIRLGETNTRDDGAREGVQAVVVSVVTAMVNAKIAGADDSPEDSVSNHTSRLD
jgi:hypothetical protein